jgi:Zn-dependent oligopeptidase
MEVHMDKSLPARPSLEQLKKLAKDLVKEHEEKQPAALALIREHLPAAAGKSDEEVARYLFALHDAQSVIARQHGFPSWNALREAVEKQGAARSETEAPADVQQVLNTCLEARKRRDYALLCTVCSEQFTAFVTQERFEAANERLEPYFAAEYRITYMGFVQRQGRPVHFWRFWVEGWDTDLLIRMVLNAEGKISGLLYSDPFDTGLGARK